MKKLFAEIVEYRGWIGFAVAIGGFFWLVSWCISLDHRTDRWYRDCLTGDTEACCDCAAYGIGAKPEKCEKLVPIGSH